MNGAPLLFCISIDQNSGAACITRDGTGRGGAHYTANKLAHMLDSEREEEEQVLAATSLIDRGNLRLA